jgi:hypothetical protein
MVGMGSHKRSFFKLLVNSYNLSVRWKFPSAKTEINKV